MTTQVDTSAVVARGEEASTVGRYRWLVCALLFFATTINYMDRQILSLLKPILDSELKWTNEQFGQVNAAFQAAYAIGLLCFGALIDRVGSRIGYAISIAAWSLAAVAHAAAGSVGGFCTARVALGLGEGGNFPSAIKAVAQWFPKRERAFATALFNSGSNVGAIIAPAVIPWLALTWGWQSAFVAAGVAGFFWLLLVVALLRRSRKSEEAVVRRARSHSERRRRERHGGQSQMAEHPAPSAGLGFHRRQVLDRSGVVVLFDLAARLLQGHARPGHQEELGAPGIHLRHRDGAQHRRVGGSPAT